MILALLVLSCLVATVVIATAVRRHALPPWLGVPAVTLLPLAGWLFLQVASRPARSPLELEVLGQYHRLSERVRISTRADADVVLMNSGSDVDIELMYDPQQRHVRVHVARAGVPVVLGNEPVNALPLGGRAVVTSSSGARRTVVRPLLCWQCDTRYVESDSGRTEVRLGSAPWLRLGADSVRLLRVGGTAYVVADPGAGVRVDSVPIPADAVALADSLFVGWPPVERLFLRPLPAQHRLEVLFAESGIRRWVLPAPADDTLRLLVSATNADPLPGTMSVLNPAAGAPGAAAEPYGGVLALRDGAWSWISGGETRPFAEGEEELLPGPQRERAAGHIVRVRQYDTDPAAARWAVVIAWLTGMLALTWLWRYVHPEALALRTALLGGVYTLIAVRGALAFRAWLAPPHDVNSPQTFSAVLLALPALVAVLHIWTQYSAQRLQRDQAVRELAVSGMMLVVGVSATMLLVLPSWRGMVLTTTAATIVLAVAGIALLNGLLLHGRERVRGLAEPLAAVTVPAQPGYTYRQFLAALFVLGTLGFLLLVVQQLLRYSTLLALVAWGTMAAAALIAMAGPRPLIRRRSKLAPLVTAVVAALAVAAVALGLRLGILTTIAAPVVAGALTYVLRARASLQIRPFHLHELAGPPLLLALLVSLAAILVPGLVGVTRVVAEYALALAGLIVIGRIFAILWFRHTQQIVQHPHVRRARRSLPGFISVGAVLLLLLGIVYVPLAMFDTGLVLLFFAATTTAVFLGFYAMGARAVAVLIPAAVVAVFFLGMFVRPASLADGSASLSTAQIRYAATYHPVALQRHMLTSDDARPVTTVRTLQQYWGVRHFAAAGTTGRGYFNAGYADWIVPRPVALTENVYSTFVLSEHGWVGGAAVLLCYLALALALLYGAVRSCARTSTAPRALLLVGIAAFWVVPAFYIAAANGVLLPLTGQNMPLLGLLSAADVALGSWLAAFGLTALPIEGTSGTEHVRSGGWTTRLRTGIASIAVVFTAAAVALIALLWRPVHADVGDFALDGVIADVESLVEQGALQVVPAAGGDTIAVAAAAGSHPLLRPDGFMHARVRRANAIARGEAPGASCLDSDALLRARDDGSIAVFGSLCSIRANVESRYDWTAPLVARTSRSEFVLSDGRTAVVLDPQHAADVVIGGSCANARAGVVRAQTVRIGCGATGALLRFGTSAPVLEQVAATGVLLNEAPAKAPTLIRHGDHLRVAGGADVWALELPRGAFSYPRWENGGLRRINDTQLTPWLAQVDSQLARGLAHAERAAWDAELTLRAPLHRQLQTALAEACATVPGVRRCSALIADPFTGAILALGATRAQPHRYLSADPNLRNHPAASAIKPIIAAAALHAYPQLRTLEIDHSGAEYSTVANTAVQPAIRAGRLYPAARVPWRGYIGASDNLYAATLGFLATSSPNGDGVPSLRGNQDESQLRLNGRPLRGQPTWAGVRGQLDLSESPLATALRELYGVYIKADLTPPYDPAFWNRAIQVGALTATTAVQRITPEPVRLDMHAFSSPRELAAFMIGGGGNRWNNVALVQALSRIYSGRAVDLHVLRRIGPHELTPSAADFAGSAEARRAVLDAMAAVTHEPWGTAYALRSAFPNVTWRAKTGTLLEREWVGSVFLFAGGSNADEAKACGAAGVVTVELNAGAAPEGRATAVFRDAIAPLLRRHLGWGDTRCT